MKKHFIILVLVLVAFLLSVFPDSIHAAVPRTTLKYYSPKDGAVFSHDAVTFSWNIHSWDEVLAVAIVIYGPIENDKQSWKIEPRQIVFYGNESKKKSHAVTDLLPNSEYMWDLLIQTTKSQGSFWIMAKFATK